MDPEIAISVRDLVKIYQRRSSHPVRALDGLSLEVRRGEIYGLLGRNGAGKTTLLRVLTTLLEPTSGMVSVNGIDVRQNPLGVRESICAVLQENAVEIFLSVYDNFVTYARFHGIPTGEIPRRAGRVMELFGLQEQRNQKVIDLSGGLKRRVQVAKVFMVDRPIVFLDEATTGMDPVNKRVTLDAIREEARKGRTLFLTTHILQEAEELCDTISIIDRGRCVASGNLEFLRSLAADAYDVSVTFERMTEEVLDVIRRFPVISLSHRRSTLDVTLRGKSRDAFEVLTALAQVATIAHFEVSSASLEDVFMQLLARETPGRTSGESAPS
jgi:ABC-2 type transport system ATP-binding protein